MGEILQRAQTATGADLMIAFVSFIEVSLAAVADSVAFVQEARRARSATAESS